MSDNARLEAAAQALTDYWEPMRGHKELYQEIDLGQAEWVIAALDKHDAEQGIARVRLDENNLMFLAHMLAAIKYPDKQWETLDAPTKSLFRLNATIVLNSLTTRHPDPAEVVKPVGRKQGPPCMSCGCDRNTAPPTKCKDKKSHV